MCFLFFIFRKIPRQTSIECDPLLHRHQRTGSKVSAARLLHRPHRLAMIYTIKKLKVKSWKEYGAKSFMRKKAKNICACAF